MLQHKVNGINRSMGDERSAFLAMMNGIYSAIDCYLTGNITPPRVKSKEELDTWSNHKGARASLIKTVEGRTEKGL